MTREVPFKESLTPTNCDSRMVEIRTLGERTDILIRERAIEPGESLEKIQNTITEAKKFFKEMAEKYDINIVSMDTVVGKNEKGERAVFTIIDKIEGESLSKIEVLPFVARDELEQLYVSLAHYYHDIWKQDKKYWADGNNTQFMYGHKQNSDDNHFFLVDVDARFYLENENEFFPIEWLLHNICKGLVEAEGKLEEKIRLEKARDSLLTVINEMIEKKPDDKWLYKAREILGS